MLSLHFREKGRAQIGFPISWRENHNQHAGVFLHITARPAPLEKHRSTKEFDYETFRQKSPYYNNQ
jgi:hypothetical protein